LKSSWFYILSALADEDLHGLGIVRNVLEQTQGAVRLWPATLYGALEDMTEGGLIVELAADAAPPQVSNQRRYYRITDGGRDTLRAEAERLAGMASVAIERLGRT